jgi:hypothetical protein
METSIPEAISAGTASPQANAPDRVILVYNGDSGVGAMLLDVVKKAVGREDCPLCEITYGALGKARSVASVRGAPRRDRRRAPPRPVA